MQNPCQFSNTPRRTESVGPRPVADPNPHPRSLKLPSSAFSAGFLEKLRVASRLATEAEEVPSTQAAALLAGPLAVEAVDHLGEGAAGHRWAVVRREEPLARGGKAAGLFYERADALRAAAVLPAVAAPSPYHLKDRPTRLGLPLHCHRRHVGHVCRLAPERREALRAHLHVVHYLATNPEALALVLEALGSEALPVLGRALARRVEARLP